MRKLLSCLFVGAIAMSLTSCGCSNNNPVTSEYSSSSVTSSETTSSTLSNTSVEGGVEADHPEILRIHFANAEDSYVGLVFWLWSKGYEPETEAQPTGTDDFGMYLDVDTSKFVEKGETSISFLVKKEGSWSYQTADVEIVYKKYTMVMKDGKVFSEVYANALTKNNIELSASYDPNAGKIATCYFSDLDKIHVSANKTMENYTLYAFDKTYYTSSDTSNTESYVIARGSLSSDSEDISLSSSFSYDMGIIYKLSVSFNDGTSSNTSSKNVDCTYLLKNKVEYPVYTGNDLGVTFDSDGYPVFKVYAPTSPLVQINLYRFPYPSSYLPAGTRSDIVQDYDTKYLTFNLNRGENGVHTSEGTTNSNWDTYWVRKYAATKNLYYTITVYNQLGTHEVIDPYANIVSLNSSRALIKQMDNEDITPTSWADLPLKWDGDATYDISSPCDLVISEQHIRDLTMSSTWTDNEEYLNYKGTYKAFYQQGTTYTKDGVSVKTGFDHLEEYGVNAIQLQPIFDQDNDELSNNYNWGYNPLNYNAPEGIYCSDPYDTMKRVYELRELVAKYANNKNHTRIIMDVVYNHVSKAQSSNFEYLVPGYYFRTNSDGDLLNASGCGNEVKSEAPMMRKFIVDSLCHWARDYKIKGFRFDLMAILDTTTLKQAKQALYEIDPDIVIYGEGWDATGDYYSSSSHANTGSVYSSLYSTSDSKGVIGAFNDTGRNALKGENSKSNSSFYGFISQSSSDLSREKVSKVADMMKGINTGKGANPEQTVNYASCHDNFTLFDQLNWTLSDDGGKTEPSIEKVAKASVAVNGMIILSNGISFINGGEEIFRSKVETDESSSQYVMMYGKMISHNSYKSSDEVNAYDYSRKVDLLDYYNMYRELIQIRSNLEVIKYPDNCNDKQAIDAWDIDSGTTISIFRKGKNDTKYHFFLNGRSSSASFAFDSANAVMLFNNNSTFTKTSSGLTTSSKYALAVYTKK